MEFYIQNKSRIKSQSTREVVDVSSWAVGDLEIYREGSRPKEIFYCPNNIAFSFLIKDHTYIFKHSRKNYPEQFWIEIIAYKLGKIVGIPVPPAFVAIDSHRKIAGALIEWFHNYPNSPEETYYAGRDYMRQKNPNYDLEKGWEHNMKIIIEICAQLQDQGALQSDWLQNFVSILLFDALIGNTDRHQDNWGLVWDKELKYAFLSPAFDNGTAMGHEILEANINTINIMEYIKRGRHHLRWDLEGYIKKGCKHVELLQKLIDFYPDNYNFIMQKLNFSVDECARDILELCCFDVYTPLSKTRANFIIELLKLRKDNIIKSLKSN